MESWLWPRTFFRNLPLARQLTMLMVFIDNVFSIGDTSIVQIIRELMGSTGGRGSGDWVGL